MISGKRKQLKGMARDAHAKMEALAETIDLFDREFPEHDGESKMRQVLVRAHADAVARFDDYARDYMILVLGVGDD